MKFAIPLCPECGEPAATILEHILSDYNIELDDEGEYQYTGAYKDWIETSEPVLINNQATVYCESRHEWLTEIAE